MGLPPRSVMRYCARGQSMPSRQHDDGGVGVVARLLQQVVAVVAVVVDARLVQLAEVGVERLERAGREERARVLEAAVHLGEVLVVGDAARGERVEDARGVAGDATRAGAARDPLRRAPAEHVHAVYRAVQRQRAALVLEKHDAFALDRLGEGGARGLLGLDARRRRVNAIRVEVGVDGLAETHGGDVGHDDHGEKDHGKRPAHDPENARPLVHVAPPRTRRTCAAVVPPRTTTSFHSMRRGAPGGRRGRKAHQSVDRRDDMGAARHGSRRAGCARRTKRRAPAGDARQDLLEQRGAAEKSVPRRGARPASAEARPCRECCRG